MGGQRSTPIRRFTSRQQPAKIPFPVQTVDENPIFTEEELKEFEQKLIVEKSAISRKAEELQKEKAVLQQEEEEMAQQRQQLQQVHHLKTRNKPHRSSLNSSTWILHFQAGEEMEKLKAQSVNSQVTSKLDSCSHVQHFSSLLSCG